MKNLKSNEPCRMSTEDLKAEIELREDFFELTGEAYHQMIIDDCTEELEKRL